MRRSMLGVALVATAAMGWAAGGAPAAAEAQPVAGQKLGGRVLAAYLEMAAALVADSPAGVAERAAKIAADAGSAAKGAAGAERAALESLATSAGRVTGKDVAALRGQFKDFSKAMEGYLRASGTPGWSLFYCPMAEGYWLQAVEEVSNPYYGKAMLRCGDRVEKIEG